ncbi:MAG: DUF5946 family protein [Candidatus Nanopelagicales bacterium]
MSESPSLPDSGCPGCGEQFPAVVAPTHPYLDASPACWQQFGLLLAAQYSNAERMGFHQVVVDTYAAQHPGTLKDRRQVQSTGIHLITLCLFLDHGVDPVHGSKLHARMVNRPTFQGLKVPEQRGLLTVTSVPTSGPAVDARNAAYAWAEDVWRAWSEHHDAIRSWLQSAALL